MSITLGGEVRGMASLRNIDAMFDRYHQDAIGEAARAGEAYLRDESNDSVHTPIRQDYRGLIESVGPPYQNQYSVTFHIGGVVTDRKDGKPKPYGYAQEFGYHDRAGGYHEGHHMVQHAAEEAARVYLAFMTGDKLGEALGFAKPATTTSTYTSSGRPIPVLP